MFLRVVLAVAVLSGISFVPLFAPPRATAQGGPLNGSARDAATLAAPAAIEVGGLSFSEGVNERGEPQNQQVEFGSGIERIWISFEYRNSDPGTRLSYIVRVNGDDVFFDDIDCCSNRNGRLAFALERRSGRDLPGGAYAVFVYAGDTEVASGSFGVRGTGGLDDNDNNESNDNDDDDDD